MKKLIIYMVVFTLFIVIIIGTNVYATTPTLVEIANKFNNCNTVKEYATHGSVWKATNNGNKLTISITANSTTTNLEYTLSDSILSANFSENNALTGLLVTIVLTDSIGQLHGYSDGELFTTLNSDKISSYTVKNEGFEVKETSDKNYQIKIDISKKIPLIDKSEASKAFTNSNSTTETKDNENKTVLSNDENKVANISVMPRTGAEQNPILIIAYILTALAVIGIISLIITRKRK